MLTIFVIVLICAAIGVAKHRGTLLSVTAIGLTALLCSPTFGAADFSKSRESFSSSSGKYVMSSTVSYFMSVGDKSEGGARPLVNVRDGVVSYRDAMTLTYVKRLLGKHDVLIESNEGLAVSKLGFNLWISPFPMAHWTEHHVPAGANADAYVDENTDADESYDVSESFETTPTPSRYPIYTPSATQELN